jgi:hypothetical protein
VIVGGSVVLCLICLCVVVLLLARRGKEKGATSFSEAIKMSVRSSSTPLWDSDTRDLTSSSVQYGRTFMCISIYESIAI